LPNQKLALESLLNRSLSDDDRISVESGSAFQAFLPFDVAPICTMALMPPGRVMLAAFSPLGPPFIAFPGASR